MGVNMGIGVNMQETDDGLLTGYKEAIACGVWFTSTGRPIPKSIKYKGDDEQLHLLANIRINRVTRRNYCGIPTLVYNCTVNVDEQTYHFTLINCIEDIEKQKWKILWR